MQQTGTKLVFALTALALLLGITSWWYRYEAAHRATQFWGAEASRLITESKGFELWSSSEPRMGVSMTVQSGLLFKVKDLSHARGQAHLRHAFMSDRNYLWENPSEPAAIGWQWSLRFYEGERETNVELSSDLKTIGKYDVSTDSIIGYSCEPMTASLKQYFEALGLLAKPQAAASTDAE